MAIQHTQLKLSKLVETAGILMSWFVSFSPFSSSWIEKSSPNNIHGKISNWFLSPGYNDGNWAKLTQANIFSNNKKSVILFWQLLSKLSHLLKLQMEQRDLLTETLSVEPQQQWFNFTTRKPWGLMLIQIKAWAYVQTKRKHQTELWSSEHDEAYVWPAVAGHSFLYFMALWGKWATEYDLAIV